MDKLLLLSGAAVCITNIAACLCLFVKPIRNRVLGLNDIREGQKCLLRSEMLHTYYKHRESQTIRQYELEDFLYLYRGYKALGGNSFIDRIKSEIDEWEVVS